jgi:Zn-dependent M28 family amino/carboxypeptidase
MVHRSFDMMGKRLYKTYRDLSNIIVRVSNGTDAGKLHALLVNAHLDSTLPSPGASDDALPCGIMLEAFRVLTQTPEWSPHHAIIFRECIPIRVSGPFTVMLIPVDSVQ